MANDKKPLDQFEGKTVERVEVTNKAGGTTTATMIFKDGSTLEFVPYRKYEDDDVFGLKANVSVVHEASHDL